MADSEVGRRKSIRDEADRIHESAVYCAQGQYEAAERWRLLHWTFGALAAGLSAGSAVITFAADAAVLSGILALAAALVAAVMTGVRHDKLAEQAQTSGNLYTALRNNARQFRDIAVPSDDLDDLRDALTALTARAAEIDGASDLIPTWANKRAKKNIANGGQEFGADGGQ